MKTLVALVALVAVGAGAWFFIVQPHKPQPATDSLSYALALARHEPLLALAGTDPDALRAATAELEAAREGLATLQNDGEAAQLIRSGLYPTRFLRALAALEEARQEFLRTEGARPALRYDEALETALGALREDTAAFKASFEHAVPTTTPPYQVLGGTVSRASLVTAITELEQRAQELSEEHVRRKQCIYEDIVGCTMPDPSTLAPRANSGAAAEAPPLVEEVRGIRAELLEDAGLLRAPIIALEGSACVPELPSPHYFLAREESAGPLAPPIEFLGDILLQPIPPSPQGPVLGYLAERGARYYPPSPVAFYQCPEVGSDLGRIFGALSIYRELGASSPVISESAALRLLRDALEEENGRYTELALAAKNRSARFDALVGEIAAFGKNDAEVKQAGIPVDVGVLYLFYVKSGFPSLYLGYNTSVTGGSGISVFESRGAAELGERLVRWSEIRGTVSREELLRNMRVFFTMHDDPHESVRAKEI